MKRLNRVRFAAVIFCITAAAASPLFAEQFGTTPVKGKITFIELGSVNCVPCQMMQPVMIELQNTFPTDVAVVFYDVWTPLGKPYADKYRIRVIPTQVFLDREGNEFFRHEGFFPLADILKVLESQGVKNR